MKNDPLDKYPNLLEQLACRPAQNSAAPWKSALRLVILVIAALSVAYAANWLLDFFHLDPFGIREIEW